MDGWYGYLIGVEVEIEGEGVKSTYALVMACMNYDMNEDMGLID